MKRTRLSAIRLLLFAVSVGAVATPAAAMAAIGATSPSHPGVAAPYCPARSDGAALFARSADAQPLYLSSQQIDMREEGYNSQYLFGMTRGVAQSTLTPGLKPLCFLFTVPLDIVLLPFAAIGGFF